MRALNLDIPPDVRDWAELIRLMNERLRRLSDAVQEAGGTSGEWNYDARGNRIVNVGDASESRDALNLGSASRRFASASALAALQASLVGGGSTRGVPVVQALEPDGSRTTFNLAVRPASADAVMLIWNGSVQARGASINGFTVSGSSITTGFTADASDTLVAWVWV